MRIIGKTDIGKSRAENQDTYRSGFLPRGGVWGVVCDGMGGAQHGKLAATLAADCIEEQLFEGLRKGVPEDGMEVVMRQAFELANGEVYARSGEGAQVMGTTAVCAVVLEDEFHIAHVGDSRAYLFEDGNLTRLTKDHSMVQDLVDQGTLTAEQADHHPDKNVITRALGVDGKIIPDYARHSYRQGALLLLCTDGLSNLVPDERVAEVLASVDFYDLTAELVSDALLAGGTDNVTALIIEMREGKANE